MIRDIRRSWRLFGWTVRFCFRPIWRWSYLVDTDPALTFEREMNSRCYCPVGWWLFLRLPFGVVWLDADNLSPGPCWCDVAIAEHFGRCVECYSEPCVGAWCAECLAVYGLTEAPRG